jgi:hypothetical protein
MPFAQLCLTNDGQLQNTDTVNIFSDVDNFTTAFITNLSVSEITGDNCPYIIDNLPEGTTQIYIVDSTGEICTYLNLQSSDLCTSCEFSFDTYQELTVGQIVAGNLISNTCEGTISDYVISWYDSEGNVAFTSGFGDYFDYNFTHPLVGNSSPITLPGTYQPVIDQIIIDGTIFSSFESDVDDYNTVFASLADCLPSITVTVESFRCDGPFDNKYSNQISYSGLSSNLNTIPPVLSTSLDMEDGMKYLAFSFQAFSVSDEIKIIYSGSNYNQKFILQWWKLDSSPSVQYDWINTPLPYVVHTFPNSSFIGVIPLTGFTNINYETDKIIFEVIPNQQNIDTNWVFKWECLSEFDCFPCYITETPKINASDTSFGLLSSLNPCAGVGGGLFVQECSNPSAGQTMLDYFNGGASDSASMFFNQNPPFTGNTLQLNGVGSIKTDAPLFDGLSFGPEGLSDNCGFVPYPQPSPQSLGITNDWGGNCFPPTTNEITFQKTYFPNTNSSTIYMTFESYDDFWRHYSYLDYFRTQFFTGGNDPTQLGYYERIIFRVLKPSNPDQVCGDTGISFSVFQIHKNYGLTSGLTVNNYYSLTLTLSAITNQLPDSSCCKDYAQVHVVTPNNSAVVYPSNEGLGNSISWSSNVGAQFSRPACCPNKILSVPQSGVTKSSWWSIFTDAFQTVPADYDDPTSLYPQYSAITCPNILDWETRNLGTWRWGHVRRFTRYVFYIYLSDPEDLNAYKIDLITVNNIINVFHYDGNNVQYCDSTYVNC